MYILGPDSDSVVFCTDYSGFFFGMSSDVKILNLRLTHCGAVSYPPELPLLDISFLEVLL